LFHASSFISNKFIPTNNTRHDRIICHGAVVFSLEDNEAAFQAHQGNIH
jgi:hypothetical protein